MTDVLLFQAFLAVLVLSAIPLLASTVCSVLVSVMQTATQIQEQSIGFMVKLAALALSLFLVGGWMMQKMITLMQDYLSSLAQMGGS